MPMRVSLAHSEPLNRQGVAQTIMNLIAQALLSRQLKPGDKLPTEAELAASLKVGRNSVREAIKMLSSLGMIEIKRGVGTFIPTAIQASVLNPIILGLVYSLGGSAELWELRVLIETGVVESAIEKATAADLLALAKANERIKKAADRGGVRSRALRDLDLGFHRELLRCTHNTLIEKLGESLYLLFFASIEKSIAANPMLGYRDHLLVIDAIRNKRSDKVRRAVADRLARWARSLNGGPASGPAQPAGVTRRRKDVVRRRHREGKTATPPRKNAR